MGHVDGTAANPVVPAPVCFSYSVVTQRMVGNMVVKGIQEVCLSDPDKIKLPAPSGSLTTAGNFYSL